ncbi:Transcription factor TFIIIB component B [Rhizophlyctis rosea]|nr:Transcription factor TFIIIB component B [Rhizophlyctis rosea]
MELTSSRVDKGPGKFAPAPKFKPRGRIRPAAPSSSTSAHTTADTQQTTPIAPSPATASPATAEPPSRTTPSSQNASQQSQQPPALLSATQSSAVSDLSPSDEPPALGKEVPVPSAAGVSPVATQGATPSTTASQSSSTAAPLSDGSSGVTQTPTAATAAAAAAAAVTKNNEFAVPALPKDRRASVSSVIHDVYEEDSDYIDRPVQARATAPPKIITKNAPPPVATASPRADKGKGPARRPSIISQEPTPMEIEQEDAAMDGEPEEEEQGEKAISDMTIFELIKGPFTQGKLSKWEEQERAKAKPRGRKRKREGSASVASDRAGTPASNAGDMDVDEDDRAAVKSSPSPATPGPSTFGPKMKLVNGRMVIDMNSLMIEQARPDDDDDLEHVDEGQTRYVTSMSFSKKQRLRKWRWTDESTEKFYEALSYFGTNFELMSLIFPGLDRKHLRNKYNHEDKINPSRVTAAQHNRKAPDENLRELMRQTQDDLLAGRRREESEEADATPPRAASATPAAGAADADEDTETAAVEEPRATPTPQQRTSEPARQRSTSMTPEESKAAALAAKATATTASDAPPARIPAPVGDSPRRGRPGGGPSKFAPKIGPKAVPRRRKAPEAPASSAAATATEEPTQPTPTYDPIPATEPEPQSQQPAPTTSNTTRPRAIPTIATGARKAKASAIMTPAMRKLREGQRAVSVSSAEDGAGEDGDLVMEELGSSRGDAVGGDEMGGEEGDL